MTTFRQRLTGLLKVYKQAPWTAFPTASSDLLPFSPLENQVSLTLEEGVGRSVTPSLLSLSGKGPWRLCRESKRLRCSVGPRGLPQNVSHSPHESGGLFSAGKGESLGPPADAQDCT